MFASFTKDVRGVDLSFSLISSWDTVALIVVELPSLQRLSLNNNRLQPLSNLKQGRDAFSHLTELQLNATLMTWQAIMGVVCQMPRLQRLESGYNRLQYLSSLPQNHPEFVITTLNLDSNQLSNWFETCQALVSFHKLVRLVLSSNSYESIPVPTGHYIPLKLTHLSLSLTRISEWSSVDSLNLWCPELESLTVNGTPLMEGELPRSMESTTFSL
jgi:Leucine-rich repeat (LRR) protein